MYANCEKKISSTLPEKGSCHSRKQYIYNQATSYQHQQAHNVNQQNILLPPMIFGGGWKGGTTWLMSRWCFMQRVIEMDQFKTFFNHLIIDEESSKYMYHVTYWSVDENLGRYMSWKWCSFILLPSTHNTCFAIPVYISLVTLQRLFVHYPLGSKILLQNRVMKVPFENAFSIPNVQARFHFTQSIQTHYLLYIEQVLSDRLLRVYLPTIKYLWCCFSSISFYTITNT